MHVLIANNIYPPHAAGGAELIVQYLAEELVRRDHAVTVVSTCGPEMEPYPDEVTNGVRVIRFFPKNLYWSFTRGPQPGWKKALWHLRDAWNPSAAQQLRQRCQELPPAVLHSHLIDGFSASIWRVAKRWGAGVVHTAHDYHLICPRAFMMTRDWKLCTRPSASCRAYAQWHVGTTRYVDVFTAPSRFLIERHQERGMRVANTSVVPNGIPTPALGAAPRVRAPGAPLRLLLAARLTPEKGIAVALEALRKVPLDVPVTLDVAGKGPLAADVEAAAAADPRIVFHGYVTGEQKHQLFSEVDCLLLPSLWYENAPVVIVEAGAYGLGVIGSRIGAIPEFIEHGKNGLLFDVGSAAALTSQIVALAAAPEQLLQFRTHGRALAARSSVQGMASAYEALYSEVARR